MCRSAFSRRHAELLEQPTSNSLMGRYRRSRRAGPTSSSRSQTFDCERSYSAVPGRCAYVARGPHVGRHVHKRDEVRWCRLSIAFLGIEVQKGRAMIVARDPQSREFWTAGRVGTWTANSSRHGTGRTTRSEDDQQLEPASVPIHAFESRGDANSGEDPQVVRQLSR